MQNPQDVKLAAEALKKRLPRNLQSSLACGIVLGTGLSNIPDYLSETLSCKFDLIPFSQIPGLPAPRVQSHAGSMAVGVWDRTLLIIQMGRIHLYEGYTPAEVCLGVRIMAALGVPRVILTNAAGSLNPLFLPGTLMRMSDYINHTGVSPLTGTDPAEHRFPDMSAPFDPHLCALADCVAMDMGIKLERGVYIGVHGPELETRAETRMYRQWGADAVGMSTVLEVIAGRQAGMAVLGISSLTNQNLPDCPKPVSIEDVAAAAMEVGKNLAPLLSGIIAHVPELNELKPE